MTADAKEVHLFAGAVQPSRRDPAGWLPTYHIVQLSVATTGGKRELVIHLAVRPTCGGRRVDVLLNDISGETFEAVVKLQSACERLVILPRADHLAVLVDGAALADPKRRHDQEEQVNDFLVRVIQGGHCGWRTALHLVIAKLDKLSGNLPVAERLEREIRNRFDGKFGSIKPWRIAARPMDNSNPTAEVIGKLFASWVQSTHRYLVEGPVPFSRNEWERDFCLYGSYLAERP